MFKYIFSDSGIVNYILTSLNLIEEPVQWLTSTGMALPTVIITNIWVGIPFDMLLLSTGLSNIPADVYESATLDGAGKLQKFFLRDSAHDEGIHSGSAGAGVCGYFQGL